MTPERLEEIKASAWGGDFGFSGLANYEAKELIDEVSRLNLQVQDLQRRLEKAENPLLTREGDTIKDFARVIKERDAALLQVSELQKQKEEIYKAGAKLAEEACKCWMGAEEKLKESSRLLSEVVEVWGESWDCSATPGHGPMHSLVAKIGRVLDGAERPIHVSPEGRAADDGRAAPRNDMGSSPEGSVGRKAGDAARGGSTPPLPSGDTYTEKRVREIPCPRCQGRDEMVPCGECGRIR